MPHFSKVRRTVLNERCAISNGPTPPANCTELISRQNVQKLLLCSILSQNDQTLHIDCSYDCSVLLQSDQMLHVNCSVLSQNDQMLQCSVNDFVALGRGSYLSYVIYGPHYFNIQMLISPELLGQISSKFHSFGRIRVLQVDKVWCQSELGNPLFLACENC